MTRPDRRAKLLLKWLLPTLLTLTGCATTATPIAATVTPHASPNAVCLALHPLTYSKADTDATIEEIRQQNAAIRKLCP